MKLQVYQTISQSCSDFAWFINLIRERINGISISPKTHHIYFKLNDFCKPSDFTFSCFVVNRFPSSEIRTELIESGAMKYYEDRYKGIWLDFAYGSENYDYVALRKYFGSSQEDRDAVVKVLENLPDGYPDGMEFLWALVISAIYQERICGFAKGIAVIVNNDDNDEEHMGFLATQSLNRQNEADAYFQEAWEPEYKPFFPVEYTK